MKEVKNVSNIKLETYTPAYIFKAGEVKRVPDDHATSLLSNKSFKLKETKETKKLTK